MIFIIKCFQTIIFIFIVNFEEITIKMKTIVRKLLMIKKSSTFVSEI